MHRFSPDCHQPENWRASDPWQAGTTGDGRRVLACLAAACGATASLGARPVSEALDELGEHQAHCPEKVWSEWAHDTGRAQTRPDGARGATVVA